MAANNDVTSVLDCRPGDVDLNMKVKVLDSKPIAEGKKTMTECLIGDSSACVLFTAKGDQCSVMKTGECVSINGAKVEMYKGSMRLIAIPEDSTIEKTSETISASKTSTNMSLIEFERVIVGANPTPPRGDHQKNGAAKDNGVHVADE